MKPVMTVARTVFRLGRQVLNRVFVAPSTSGAQIWSIGLYAGPSPFDLGPAKHVANPVLTGKDVNDVAADFVADPFMLRRNERWFMFFEVMNHDTGRGAIGLATSDDGGRWTYQQIVLAEPFHLSYPYVFEWDSEVYMVPETFMDRAVRLYRAIEFPTRWLFETTLIEGEEFCDPSPFFFKNRWWLFVGLGQPPWRADRLCLYHAERLTGPWREHPASPLVEGDPRTARPAGRVLQFDGKIFRFAQDCHPNYGTHVRAFEITELTASSYGDREVDQSPVLTGGARGWNRSGMHHIDLHRLETGGWVASVDGWTGSPRVTARHPISPKVGRSR